MKEMKYKGYIGSVEVSEADNCLFGKLLHINDLGTYEAETPRQLVDAFHEATDDYLATCAELDKEPDTPYKGVFNVRTQPSTHRELATMADMLGKKLNTFANDALVLATTVVKETYVQAGKAGASPLVVKFDERIGDFVVESLDSFASTKRAAPAKSMAPAKPRAKRKTAVKTKKKPARRSARAA
jgi:predicted HicB family RNase H-like nuclease